MARRSQTYHSLPDADPRTPLSTPDRLNDAHPGLRLSTPGIGLSPGFQLGSFTVELQDPGSFIWTRSPNFWPDDLKTMLRRVADADESLGLREVLQVLMSEMHEGRIKNALQCYVKEEADQNRANGVRKAMYQLMHLAPHVGAKFLDFSLEAATQTAELYMHLGGKIREYPMRSIYVEEQEEDEKAKDAKEEGFNGNDANVYEVIQHRCLIPNVLNIHMLQALAKTEAVDLFVKKSIQAMVSETWNGQVRWVIRVCLVLRVLEVVTLLLWGLTSKDGGIFDRLMWLETHNATSSAWLEEHAGIAVPQPGMWNRVKAWNGEGYEAIKWNILAALNLEQLLEIGTALVNARQCSNVDDECTKDLWNDRSRICRWSLYLNSNSIHFITRTLFLLCALLPLNDRNVMVYAQQLMLSLTYCTSVVGMFTIFTCFPWESGLSVVSMRKTFFDTAVVHFTLMLMALFVIMMLAWMMLDREKILLAALQTGWRALVLSEEHDIEDISDVPVANDGDTFGYVAEFGAFWCLFFFSIFLTNLLIAVFSDAYSKARKKVWVSFFQRRIIIARNCILSRPATAPCFLQRLQRWPLWATVGAGVAIAALMQFLVHNDFIIQHWLKWPISLVSMSVFALTVCVLKAAKFKFVSGRNTWFSEEPEERRVLLVWCRKDFSETIWLGSADDRNDTQRLIHEMHDMKADLHEVKDNLNKLLQQLLPPDRRGQGTQ